MHIDKTFFKQSGWMVLATAFGGAIMFAVHPIFLMRGLHGQAPKSEYANLLTYLQILTQMTIPAAGLQIIFAQQAAAAVDESRRRQLASTVRMLLATLFLLWLLVAGFVGLYQNWITQTLSFPNATGLWVTLFLGLASLWKPIIDGLLQGTQNFTGLGFVSIFNGIGRIVAIEVIVLLLGGQSAGAMFGAFLGLVLSMGLGLWQCWPIFCEKGESFAVQDWFKRVIPLILGAGLCSFMMSIDMLVVKSSFDATEAGFYGAVGTIGRALVFFTIPLTSVMFPKIVNDAALSRETRVLSQALGATGLLAIVAVIACFICPSLPLRLINKDFISISWLVPWFALAMSPLTLVYVMLNNLLAREQFKVVPYLWLIAGLYLLTLKYYHGSFIIVVGIFGSFNILLLIVTAAFTYAPLWRNKGPS